MGKAPAPKLPWMTCLISGGVGWALVMLFYHPAGHPGSVSSASQSKRAGASFATGKEIVDRLEAGRKACEGARNRKLNDNLRAMLEKRLAEIPADGDPAASAISALANLGSLDFDPVALEEKLGKRIDIAARVVRWLEIDPQAALDHLKSLPGEGFASTGAIFGVEFWATNEAPAELLKLALPNANANVTSTLIRVLGLQAGDSAELGNVAALLEQLQPNMATTFAGGVAEHWPAERAGELTVFAADSDNAYLLVSALRRMKGKEAYDWLITALDSGSRGDALKKFVRNSGLATFDGRESGDQLSFEEGVTLNERFNSLFSSGDTRKEREAAENLQLKSVVRSLVAGGEINELMQSFKDGEVDAAAFLDSVKTARPELSSASPDLLRNQIYGELVKKNPVEALQLFSDLPENERYQRVNMLTTMLMGSTADPELVFNLFEAVPYKPEYGSMVGRVNAWKRLTARSYATYGDDYAGWIRQLPAGVNRDMALSALAEQIQPNDPEQADALLLERSQPE